MCSSDLEQDSDQVFTDLFYQSLHTTLQQNATSWDNGCQKPPLLTPFLTPVAPRRARDRVPSILALGLFFSPMDSQRRLSVPHMPFRQRTTSGTRKNVGTRKALILEKW